MTSTATRTFERRAFPLADIRIRSANDKTGSLRFHGQSVVYGQTSDDLGGWNEIIDQGAGTRTLAGGPDCRFLINHDANLLLGRTTSGTAVLTESDQGVDVESEMANVTYARDLAVLLERGDINQMSFGFWVVRDTWSGNLHRIMEYDIDGGDVSVVTFPAYPQTSAELREQARRHGATADESRGGRPAGAAADLAAALRSLGGLSPAAAALALGGPAGSPITGESRQLLQEAIDALAAVIAEPPPAADASYPLERAKHRLAEFEFLADL